MYLYQQVVDVTSTSLRLRWDPPNLNETNGDLKGYYLGYREFKYARHIPFFYLSYWHSINIGDRVIVYYFTVLKWFYLYIRSDDVKGDKHSYNFSTIPLVEHYKNSLGEAAHHMSGESRPWTPYSPQGGGGGPVAWTIRGLRPNTRYDLVLQAYNGKGAGPSSPSTSITTSEGSKDVF